MKCVKIEEAPILPTAEQNFASVCVCQMLSNYYRAIELFRFNERLENSIFLPVKSYKLSFLGMGNGDLYET
jgi:hypothetical protein